jgi:predicted glutamine amidotransferase
MIKSQTSFEARPWLEAFADMSEASRAPDGDRQADGWGVSWINGDGGWHGLKSIAPIWTEREAFRSVTESRILLAHARSASFPDQKGVLDYSQPFVEGRHAFVFNGLLRGVSLPAPGGGGIGSQKIWNLLINLLEREEPGRSLERLAQILDKRSREISALNIGLCDGDRMYAYCRYADFPEYYHLQMATSPGLTAVCSEPLAGKGFAPAPTRTVLAF